MSNLPLPDGWVHQYDSRYERLFWVDTRAKPPRSIWVHPYEDEQFLNEHPEIRAKKEKASGSDLDVPPSYDAAVASGSGERSRSPKHFGLPDAVSGESSHTEHKRGVFGKLKDKAIGTKEEREEQKRARAERAALAEERARQERMQQRRIRAERAALAEEQARQERMRQLEEREVYMRAHGGYAPYHPGPGYGVQQPGYGPAPRPGENPALLLLGGLAGGLLLGDIFGGDF